MAARTDLLDLGLLCSAILLLILPFGSGHISCRDEEGRPVDWYIIYKYPRVQESSDPAMQQGYGYAYLDSAAQAWSRGKASMKDRDGAVYYTLKQVYDNHASQDVAYILYNDETPEKNESAAHGHTKGDVCFDGDSGFWLVHSLPRFPEYSSKKYEYPYTGTYYGQTFLCMTLAFKYFNVIGKQLQYNHPQIYDYNLPLALGMQAPDVALVVKHDYHAQAPPWWSQEVLHTLQGQAFTSFAKYNKFGKDLYDGLVAPRLSSSLYVESWQRGGRILASNCSAKYQVLNIESIRLDAIPFGETEDHSKWAMSASAARPWVCIGDINRMNSQEGRGGGTVCLRHPGVWQTFKETVGKVESCPRH